MTTTAERAQTQPLLDQPARRGWTADASTFAARLALVRLEMGWGNIAEAARMCGLPKDSWRNWEKTGREPHRITTIAAQIAGTTGCDYLWLVHGPGRGTQPAGPVAPKPVSADTYRYPATHVLGQENHRHDRRFKPSASFTRPVSQTRPVGDVGRLSGLAVKAAG